jgi:hypothetical protein
MAQSKKSAIPSSDRPSLRQGNSLFSGVKRAVISKIKPPFFLNKKTIRKEEYKRAPQNIFNLAAKGKQILIKDSDGKIETIIGSTGRNLFPETDLSDLLGEETPYNKR